MGMGMGKVSLWTTLLSFISVLTVYSIAFSQTKDCNDLSGDYVCVESRVIQNQKKINWCWDCYYGVYPGSKYVDPYAFVWGGYFAAVYYLSPRLAYLNYHIGWFSNTEVRSNVCSPNVEIPVWIGDVKYWVFYVRENKIRSKWSVTWDWDCMYPSLSPEIVLLEGTFECPGGPNLERDAKYLREIKYGKGACDKDKCKCIDFPPINQCNLPCSREKYDKREKNFCSLGCALSSLVSVMQYVGCDVDPCVVNRCNECFNDRGNVIWSNIIQKYCRDKLNSNVRAEDSPKDIQTWETFCKDNEQGIYRVLQVKLPGRIGYHFVVFKCIDDQGNILTMDPAYNIKYKPENVISIRVIRKK
jgi:hypothetical protein